MLTTIDIIRANDNILCARVRDDDLIEAVHSEDGKEELLFYKETLDKNDLPTQLLTGPDPEMYRWDKKTGTWFHSHKTLMQHKIVK